MTEIKRLHHAAYRCRDSEETRIFYEDFLGLELINALTISGGQSSKPEVLHTFFAMRDGSCLAFFEDPKQPFNFKKQRDFDLHIALEVDRVTLLEMRQKGQERGIETRGIAQHGFIESVYFRDPNGYVLELSAPKEDFQLMEKSHAKAVIAEWQKIKPKSIYRSLNS